MMKFAGKMGRMALPVILFSLMGVQQSHAWGREGHRLTALVAEHYLTDSARAEVAELLGKDTLADVAPWADSYRQEHPETGKWHYVDIPQAAATFDRMRDCPAATDGGPWRDCATDRILYFEGRLGDRSLSREDRAFALKFLVHLIGDLHQPFHAYGEQRGGNGIHVMVAGSSYCGSGRCNLHGVWDEELIVQHGLNEPKYLAHLLDVIGSEKLEAKSGGEPTTWANLSHKLADDAVVPDGAMLPQDYVRTEGAVVDDQLALGGLRLARVLNRILAPQK